MRHYQDYPRPARLPRHRCGLDGRPLLFRHFAGLHGSVDCSLFQIQTPCLERRTIEDNNGIDRQRRVYVKNSTQLLCFSLAVGLTLVPALGVALRDMVRAVNAYEMNCARQALLKSKTSAPYATLPLRHGDWRLR